VVLTGNATAISGQSNRKQPANHDLRATRIVIRRVVARVPRTAFIGIAFGERRHRCLGASDSAEPAQTLRAASIPNIPSDGSFVIAIV